MTKRNQRSHSAHKANTELLGKDHETRSDTTDGPEHIAATGKSDV